MAQTGWIFGRFDPGVEYRSKPGDESVVQRRKVATFVRYRLSCEQLPTRSDEGTIRIVSLLTASNGEAIGERYLADPAVSAKMILTDVVIDNEGGQGSGMYRATETWQYFSDWYDWTTIEDDLGVSEPF